MEKKYVANKVLLVNSEGKILLMRDSGVGDHANSKGKWDVPGGRMEHGETPIEALKREIVEEVGVQLGLAIIRPIHVDTWGVGGDMINEPIIGIFYAVQIGDATPQLSEEHTEYIWYDSKEPIPEGTKGAVASALEAYRERYAR